MKKFIDLIWIFRNIWTGLLIWAYSVFKHPKNEWNERKTTNECDHDDVKYDDDDDYTYFNYYFRIMINFFFFPFHLNIPFRSMYLCGISDSIKIFFISCLVLTIQWMYRCLLSMHSEQYKNRLKEYLSKRGKKRNEMQNSEKKKKMKSIHIRVYRNEY